MPEYSTVGYYKAEQDVTDDAQSALIGSKLDKGLSDGIERIVKDGVLAEPAVVVVHNHDADYAHINKNVRMHIEPDGTVYMTNDGTDPDPNA